MLERLRRYPPWTWTFLAVVLILLAKSWTAWAYPILCNEDGTVLFSRFRRDPSPGSVLDFYNGYISILPGIAGYLASLLPARLTPYAMGVYAAIVSLFAYSLLALPRFRPLIASDGHRVLICLLLALLPLGSSMLLSSAVYSLWNLLWILIALNLFSESRSRRGRYVQFMFSALAIWSHPLCVTLVPFLVWRYARHDSRAERRLALALLVTIGLYLLLGVRPAAGDGDRSLLAALGLLPDFVVDRVFFEALFGSMIRAHLGQESLMMIGIGSLVLGVVTWQATRVWPTLDRPRRRALIQVGLLVPILSLACIYSRAFNQHPGYAASIRYAYVQRLLWLPVLFAMLLPALNLVRLDVKKAAITCLVLLAFLSARYNHTLYEVARGESRHLAKFLTKVEAWEAAGKPLPAPFYYRPNWNIQLDDNSPAGPGR